MIFTTPTEAAAEMNRLGKEGVPFLFAFDYEMRQAFVVPDPLEQDEVLFELPGCSNRTHKKRLSTPSVEPHNMSYEGYKKGFDIIQSALLRGDSYLANYTVSTPIDMPHTLREVFDAANAPFCLLVPGRFVCFSPERFVRIEGNSISTYPMKGTIDASVPNAESAILQDPKELAEHLTVVDLLRNDIGMVADKVEVRRFRYIERIETSQRTILQVSSHIVGELSIDWQKEIGSMMLRLLPAGSICGAPKESTCKAISEAEKRNRGFYTGVFGLFDGEGLDTAVMIRFIEQKGDRFYYHSGGGITVNSLCRKEYEEVKQKIYLPL